MWQEPHLYIFGLTFAVSLWIHRQFAQMVVGHINDKNGLMIDWLSLSAVGLDYEINMLLGLCAAIFHWGQEKSYG